MSETEPVIRAGAVIALRLFDVAYAIDLGRAEKLWAAQARASSRLRLTATPPTAMAFGVAPLALELDPVALDLPGQAVSADVTARLYDFGAIAIALRVPASGLDWPGFVQRLNQVDRLLGDGATRVWTQLLEKVRVPLAAALERPEQSAPIEEDYLVGLVQAFDDPLSAVDLQQRVDLVPLLSGEQRPLSDGARQDLLRQRFSYYTDDLVVLTWDRAFIYEPRGDTDLLDVLEVANAQLLEMRYYDELLDAELPRMYDLVESARRATSLLVIAPVRGAGARAPYSGRRSHRAHRTRGQRFAGDRGRLSRPHLHGGAGVVSRAAGQRRGGSQARHHSRHLYCAA